MWLNKNDQMVVGMGRLEVGWVKKKVSDMQPGDFPFFNGKERKETW